MIYSNVFYYELKSKLNNRWQMQNLLLDYVVCIL